MCFKMSETSTYVNVEFGILCATTAPEMEIKAYRDCFKKAQKYC